jgi:hypothetical protein
LEIRNNLEIFKSTLSATTILGGRHERIISTQMDLSHVCKWMRENMGLADNRNSHHNLREALTSGNRKEYQTELEGSPTQATRNTGHHQSTYKKDGRIINVDGGQEEQASYRHNRPREVKLGNLKIDNGAVHKITRTNTTGHHIDRSSREEGMPQDRQDRGQTAVKDERKGPSLEQKTKVITEISQTAIGSLFHRTANRTKIEKNRHNATSTKHAQRHSTENLQQLMDLELD